jgi:predicted phosphodiesterase
MRVFALSDIHVDYDVNARWIQGLSKSDYREDVLILAGDVTHKLSLLAWCLSALAARFKRVLFVPGNHELWVLGAADREKTSLQKFEEVAATVEANGASMQPLFTGSAVIAPLLGWYDYTFGKPSDELKEVWMDYRACRWPEGFGPDEAAVHFTRLNLPLALPSKFKVITFSHFLPRLDLVPEFVSRKHRMLDPVLGSTRLERQLRERNSSIHVYGHSHINRTTCIDGITYVNNAFGYPQEEGIASKRLLCIDEI